MTQAPADSSPETQSKDLRNWYAYCDSNPVQFVDPNGLVKITLHWYTVIGANGYNFVHLLIIDTDNVVGSTTYGQQWIFSGGPQNHASEPWADFGNLVSYSGKWKGRNKHGGQDDNPDNPWGGGVVLVDDQSSYANAVAGFQRTEKRIIDTESDYGLVPRPGYNQGNSNSFVWNLLAEAGLMDEKAGAMQKRRRAGYAPLKPPGCGVEL